MVISFGFPGRGGNFIGLSEVLRRTPSDRIRALRPPPSLHLFFRSGTEGQVHPVAGFAFFNAFESNSLDLELFSDPMVQADAPNQNVSSEDGRG